MQNIDNLSHDQLVKYTKFLSGLALAVDGLWFMAAEKATDFNEALAMDINVWTWYAPLLVKRIRRNFEIKSHGLAALKEIIIHDPMWWSMEASIIEDTPECLTFEVRECPALIAMEKMKRKQLTCEPVERAYLEALAQAIDPGIKVVSKKLPPRQSPDEICCCWAFYI